MEEPGEEPVLGNVRLERRLEPSRRSMRLSIGILIGIHGWWEVLKASGTALLFLVPSARCIYPSSEGLFSVVLFGFFLPCYGSNTSREPHHPHTVLPYWVFPPSLAARVAKLGGKSGPIWQHRPHYTTHYTTLHHPHHTINTTPYYTTPPKPHHTTPN